MVPSGFDHFSTQTTKIELFKSDVGRTECRRWRNGYRRFLLTFDFIVITFIRKNQKVDGQNYLHEKGFTHYQFHAGEQCHTKLLTDVSVTSPSAVINSDCN